MATFGASEFIALTISSIPLLAVTVAVISVVCVACKAIAMTMSSIFWSRVTVTVTLTKIPIATNAVIVEYGNGDFG